MTTPTDTSEHAPLRERLRERARALKRETHALAIAYADPRTPRAARLVTLATVAYALSPIDLIPDFVPVLGYLDDLVIVPAGLALAVKLVPADVLADARARAADPEVEARLGRRGAVAIAAAWVVLALALVLWLARVLTHR